MKYDKVKCNDFVFEGILFGSDECFDTVGFYQFLYNPDTNEMFRLYFDLVDEYGDDVNGDLGSVDYSKSFYCCEITDDDYKSELINCHYQREFEWSKKCCEKRK